MLTQAVRYLQASLRLDLVNQPGLGRTLVAATLASVWVRFGGMALTFATGVLLARYLGPEQYGVYGTAMSVAALLAVPAQFGLPQLATREISAAGAVADNARVRSVAIWFGSTVAAGALVMLAAGWVGFLLWPQSKSAGFAGAFAWGLGNIPVIAVIALGMGILRGLHSVVLAQLYDAVLRPGLMLIALVTMAALGADLNGKSALALQVTTGAIVASLCVLHIARALPSAPSGGGRRAYDRNWLKSAGPMAGTEILRMLDGQYPILLLGMLAPIRDVGLFRVAIAVAAFVGLPATLVNLVIMPHVAKLFTLGDRERLQRLATMASLFCFLATTIMVLGIALVGRPAISFLFGAQYSGAWLPLLLVGLAYVVNGFFGSGSIILNMCGQEKVVTVAFLISPAIGILCTWILYPYIGIYSAGVAMIVSQAAQGLYMYASAKRTLNLYLSAVLPRFA